MTNPTGQAEAALNLHYASGLRLASDGVRLLEAVARHGSITNAARAVGISYRTAWQRVESLNNLAATPLVERVSGGTGGGGSRVTAAGERLLEQFRALEEEHRHFLARLSARIGNANDGLETLQRIAMQTSARNQFHGRVEAIKHGAVNAEVCVGIGSGHSITAIITEDSLARLDFSNGDDAVAIVKASSIILSVEPALPTSARNHLRGSIGRLHPGAVNTDVVLDLDGGKSVGAIITNVSAERLGLAEGRPAAALFKASSVILARPGV